MDTGKTAESVIEHARWTKASAVHQDRIGKCTFLGTERLVDKTPILATDLSTGMLAQVDQLGLPNVSTQRADAVMLEGLDYGMFTHVLSSFMIQFTPAAHSAVEAMYRVLRPEGVIGIAIWRPYAGPDVIHQAAASRLKPGYTIPSAWAKGAWCTEAEHESALEHAGFKNVTTEIIQVPFEFDSAEEYLGYWFDGGNPVPGKLHADWEAHGGSREELRRGIGRLVREEYGDGKGIYFTAVLGWAKRAK